MTLFTGAAILEERFLTAYFRFNDDTFLELKPWLRPAEHSHEFVTQWNPAARNLAEGDALRLLLSFSQFLPASGPAAAAGAVPEAPSGEDRMLHARVQGRRLGIFDLYYDSLAPEQVSAAQLKTAEGQSYYDVWTSFSVDQPTGHGGATPAVISEEAKPDSIRISQYTVDAKVEPPTKLEAEASLKLEVREGGQRMVLFELSRFLQVKQVEADGQTVEFIHNQALEGTQLARRGNDLVAVIFPQRLRTGQKVSLRFVYGGDVLSEAGPGLLYAGARGTWYPNRGLEMAGFDLRFRYPVDWTLVATGKRQDDSTTGLAPGEQESHWISERPIPVAGFNLGKYSRAEAHAGAVPVEAYATNSVERTFPKGTTEMPFPQPRTPFETRRPQEQVTIAAPPPSPARNAQAVAAASARAVEFFASHFGPYPYTDLALTQMPGRVSQGWPSLIFLSSFSFLTPQEKSELHMSPVTRILSDNVIAHETAHQWWGDLISWESYRDQWMFEALANYCALMMIEVDSPPQFRSVLETYRQDLLEKNKDGSPLADAGPVTFGNRLNSSHFPLGYDAISYGRGTWLFHMLRYMMRDAVLKSGGSRVSDAQADAPFFHALEQIRQRYEEKSITTRQMLQVFEEELPPSLWFEGKQSLDWFYEGWVNGTALPHFELRGARFTRQDRRDGPRQATIAQDEEDSAPKTLVTPVP